MNEMKQSRRDFLKNLAGYTAGLAGLAFGADTIGSLRGTKRVDIPFDPEGYIGIGTLSDETQNPTLGNVLGALADIFYGYDNGASRDLELLVYQDIPPKELLWDHYLFGGGKIQKMVVHSKTIDFSAPRIIFDGKYIPVSVTLPMLQILKKKVENLMQEPNTQLIIAITQSVYRGNSVYQERNQKPDTKVSDAVSSPLCNQIDEVVLYEHIRFWPGETHYRIGGLDYFIGLYTKFHRAELSISNMNFRGDFRPMGYLSNNSCVSDVSLWEAFKKEYETYKTPLNRFNLFGEIPPIVSTQNQNQL